MILSADEMSFTLVSAIRTGVKPFLLGPLIETSTLYIMVLWPYYKPEFLILHKYYYVNLNITAYVHIIDLYLRPEVSLVSMFSIVPNISLAQFLEENLMTIQWEKSLVIPSLQYQPEQSL